MSLDMLGAVDIGSSAAPTLDAVRAGKDFIQKGMSGDSVKYVQAACGVAADGIFGSNTKTAVEVYQDSHGLPSDGVVGKDTLKVMDGQSGIAIIDALPPSAPAPIQTQGRSAPKKIAASGLVAAHSCGASGDALSWIGFVLAFIVFLLLVDVFIPALWRRYKKSRYRRERALRERGLRNGEHLDDTIAKG